MSSVLKAEEVAEQLGVTVGTLDEWRETGTGPTWLLLGSDCIRYIDSSVVQWLVHQRDTQDPALRVRQFRSTKY